MKSYMTIEYCQCWSQDYYVQRVSLKLKAVLRSDRKPCTLLFCYTEQNLLWTNINHPWCW